MECAQKFLIIATCFHTSVVLSEEPAQDVQLTVSRAGVSRYRPGEWATIAVRGVNRSEDDRVAVLSVFFEDNPRIQYARRFRIPAGTIRKTWLPILSPVAGGESGSGLRTSILEIIETETGEVLHRGGGDRLVEGRRLPVADQGMQTGTVFDIPIVDQDHDSLLDNEAYECIVAGKTQITGDRTLLDLSDRFLPPYTHVYDGLDQLVICSNRLLSDSACLSAVRGWMARGGRVWFMLDRVGPQTVRALLGHAVHFEVVDRVELTEFTLHSAGAFANNEESYEPWRSERAVDFVRVLVDGADVHSDIDGWPVTCSVSVGRGKAFFTTLGPRGFRHFRDPFSDDRGELPSSGETRAFRDFAGRFFQPRHRRLIAEDSLQPILNGQIGYQVPSLALATTLLSLNFLTILCSGVWSIRRGKLESMALIVPGIALATAAMFVGLGSINATRVPASAAVLELFEASPDTGEAFTNTAASVYSPQLAALTFDHSAFESVRAVPSEENESTNRVVWDIDLMASCEGTSVAPGTVKFVEASRNEPLSTPLEVRGRFTTEGFAGRLLGADHIVEKADAVIARAPSPSIAAELGPGGRFVCNEEHVLPADEHLMGMLLSDEQLRRLDIYRQLLDPVVDPHFPRRPTLFFWSELRDSLISLPDDFHVNGSTLYSIPLTIEPTPPGEPFVVPSSFIEVEHAGGKFGVSGFYDERTGRWAEQPLTASDAWFRFMVPKEVRPCKIEQAVLTLKVHAPSRRFDLSAIRNGERTVVASRDNPSGVLDFTIADPTVLLAEPDGALMFGLRIGEILSQSSASSSAASSLQVPRDRDRRDATSTWQIDYMKLHVRGTTD